jgi:hypothetical protein
MPMLHYRTSANNRIAVVQHYRLTGGKRPFRFGKVNAQNTIRDKLRATRGFGTLIARLSGKVNRAAYFIRNQYVYIVRE